MKFLKSFTFWGFASALLMISVCLVIILKWGIQLRPIGIMKPSQFQKAEEIGAVVYRRMFAELNAAKIHVVGIPFQPIWYGEVIQGLVHAAADEQHRYDQIIVARELRLPFDLSERLGQAVAVRELNPDNLYPLIESLAGESQKTLVVLPFGLTTELVAGSPMATLKKNFKEDIFNITLAGLSRSFGDEASLQPKCIGLVHDSQGVRDFGCFLVKSARQYYRRFPKADDKYIAILQREPYTGDTILQISAPLRKAEGDFVGQRASSSAEVGSGR